MLPSDSTPHYDHHGLPITRASPGDDAPLSAALLSPLTKREREGALLMAKGHDNRQIASTLTIAMHAVRRHVERIFTKLDMRSRLQLATMLLGLRHAS
jgi:DNA-binding NarL/FixJ family response regulator